MNELKCHWKHITDSDNDYWETACGDAFCFTADGPKENKFKYCPYCGGKIIL